MGSRKKLWLWGVLLLMFTSSCLSVSPAPLRKAFLSEHDEKFGHGAGSRGGNGGESAGRGESTGNGNSETPKGGGAAAVIPVIVAGAGNHGHHQHHGAATSRNKNLIGLPTLIFLAWASLVVRLHDLV